MSVYDKSHELAKAIRESEENREYRNISNIVYSNEKNKELINDFKKKQFEMQAKQFSGEEPDSKEIDKLQKLYEILISNPDIGKYFEVEYRFERMISDVYKILEEAINNEQNLNK